MGGSVSSDGFMFSQFRWINIMANQYKATVGISRNKFFGVLDYFLSAMSF